MGKETPRAEGTALTVGAGRRAANAFIAAVVLSQLLLPLRYYVGADEFDERFSWRMFSPIRMVGCDARWSVGGERGPVDPRAHVHEVWLTLMRRARLDVVEGFGRFLCGRLAAEGALATGAAPEVYVDLRCPHPDGRVRQPIPADRNLCEVHP